MKIRNLMYIGKPQSFHIISLLNISHIYLNLVKLQSR